MQWLFPYSLKAKVRWLPRSFVLLNPIHQLRAVKTKEIDVNFAPSRYNPNVRKVRENSRLFLVDPMA